MKAILEDSSAGRISAVDVPEPELRPGGILVQTAFSAISAGTERVKLNQTEKSLLGKALARPDLVKQVLDLARIEGIKAAYQKVHSRLDTLCPVGYSCSGIVLAAAEDVQAFQPGDRVACGGGGYANHSALNFIPQNLAVKLPPSVKLDEAALTTIGAIAMQGLRQSEVKFGESVAVIGAGLVGVLTIQLARAAGCRVVAIDSHPLRAERATKFGASLGLSASDAEIKLAVQEFTGYGADVVIITAATLSNGPVELAAAIARDRGRIVVVGDVGLGVSRPNMYLKELSLTLSRSYGPGRYDSSYEEAGNDYPVGYVRWTEKRNMEAFVQFLETGGVSVAPLIEKRYPVEQGDKAYDELRNSDAYTILIEYPTAQADRLNSTPSPIVPARQTSKPARFSVGLIGAGGFARNVIIPALRNRKDVRLEAVATASGIGAQSACKSFGFAKAQTPIQLLQDNETDMVFVLSRHDSHAQYVVTCLANHKPVFVEKPLAITIEELEGIRCAYESERDRGNCPFLMVGFNRRFAPMTEKLQQFFAKRQEPMMINVRVNAGYLALDHWTQQKLGGGRIIGEFCHFVDWTRAVVTSPIHSISARALPDGCRYHRDNVAVTLSFLDGSIANLTYLANGDKSVPKERFEVFCEGGVAILDDFSILELTRHGKTARMKSHRDKGHRREIDLTIDNARAGQFSPIPFEQLLEVSSACIAVHTSIATGQDVALHSRERGLEVEQ